MELPYCAAVDVTIQLDDTLCREARHQAVDAELSLSGWIAQLVRERIARVGGSCGCARTLLDMLGDENADGADFEIPAFPEVAHPAGLKD